MSFGIPSTCHGGGGSSTVIDKQVYC